MLDKAITGYLDNPDHSSTLLVLPEWPEAKWWPQLSTSGLFSCVGYYPNGNTLFTAQSSTSVQHTQMGPTSWGTVMSIIGKTGGLGICIPGTPWPPTPTMPVRHTPASPLQLSAMLVVNPSLTAQQQQEVDWLIHKCHDIWAGSSSTGRTNLVTHRVGTGSAARMCQKAHRLSAAKAQKLREEVQAMRKHLEPS